MTAHPKGIVLLVAVALLLAVGCGDETPLRDDARSGDGGSLAAQGPSCSATGVATACDPVSAAGCAMGDCYVIKDVGSACICPAGSTKYGDPCSTTAECLPGHVCAGEAPPGVCRKTCNPDAPDCGTGWACQRIAGWPQFGFCRPE